MDVFTLYGITPHGLDVFLSTYTLGTILVTMFVGWACRGEMKSTPHSAIGVLLISLGWPYLFYKLTAFYIREHVDARRRRKRQARSRSK